jgi:sulfoxide reductase heme-binding subunit YedZ
VLNLVKGVLCCVCLLPALDSWSVLDHMNRHFIRAYDYRVFSFGIAETGRWTFIFLLLALGCTPAQRLTGFRWPSEIRRILGLFAFFYALLHLFVYLVIGQKLRFDYVIPDALNQRSRIPGWFALLLLIPLAVTSTDGMVRWVGAKRWKNLHRLVYLATALAIAHLAWTEVDHQTSDFPLTKSVAVPFAGLMALRLVPLEALRKKLRKSVSSRASSGR